MNDFSAEQKQFLQKMANHSTKNLQEAVVVEIDARFTAYGFDIKSPIEVQKDMAFVNKMRTLVDSMVMRTIAGLIAVGTTVGVIYKCFKPFKD